MRTTVTLDPDVDAMLRALMRERGISFKQAVNSALRAGLANSVAAGKTYTLKTYNMGLRRDLSLTKALQLAADLEDENIARELESRTGNCSIQPIPRSLFRHWSALRTP